MCGINGIFNLDVNGNWTENVRRMNDALAHRGPDDSGVYEEPGLALGHRRLSIIDLSAAGHQPMTSADGRYVIVYNGELYNYRDLREQLTDYPFRTGSDTEVILAAYSAWGPDCLRRFNGMWGLAIWDKQEKTLFIARDRLGIKPVYLAARDHTWAFSSEIRALLDSGIPRRRLNTLALKEYLAYQTVHAPETLVEGVFMLMPGEYRLLSAGMHKSIPEGTFDDEHRMNLYRGKIYWPLEHIDETEKKPYGEHCTQVRRLLREAVERRLVADVPFGAFLSGGIDSSAIVALMSEVSSSPVKTFSVTFDESEFSESKYARMVAKKFGTEHQEILLRPEDFLHDLPAALTAMDHPSGDGPNTYVVSKATRQAGITMALSGLGGDELFAGYAIFRQAFQLRQRQWMGGLPAPLRRLAGESLRKLRPGVASDKKAAILAQKKFGLTSAYPYWRRALLDDQLKQLTGDILYPSELPHIMQSEPEGALRQKEYLISRVSVLEIATYMQNVLLRDTDQMSMAHALEVRVPFLDYQLVEYVLNLQDEYKFPHTPKKLLVDAMGDLLPPEIVNRPKMGFVLPWKHWMKKELRGFCEERLNWLSANGVLEKSGVEQLWHDFLKDDPHISWSRLWPLVVLGDWMERNGISA